MILSLIDISFQFECCMNHSLGPSDRNFKSHIKCLLKLLIPLDSKRLQVSHYLFAIIPTSGRRPFNGIEKPSFPTIYYTVPGVSMFVEADAT